MAGPQPDAERFLKERGIIVRMRVRQAEMLGCIICRWSATQSADGKPRVYGYQIMRCRGIEAGSLYPVISRFENAGLVTAEHEALGSDEDKGRPPRRYIIPAEGEVAEAFKQTLIVPEVCNLPSDKEA